jgi:hypothetical protein
MILCHLVAQVEVSPQKAVRGHGLRIPGEYCVCISARRMRSVLNQVMGADRSDGYNRRDIEQCHRVFEVR